MAKIIKTFNLTLVLDEETGKTTLEAKAHAFGALELLGLLQAQTVQLMESVNQQMGAINLIMRKESEVTPDEPATQQS